MTIVRHPAGLAEDAVVLLRGGRAAMALTLLEQLPEQIEAALTQAATTAYQRGQTDARRAVAAAQQLPRAHAQQASTAPPAPRKPHRLNLLRDALADPIQREMAKATLGMGDSLLDRIAAGGATLSCAQWRRLREVLR